MAIQTPVSPKVKASTITAAVTGLLLTAIVAGIGAITPGLFAFLGAWQGVAYAVVIAAGTYLAGYLATDPLRLAGAKALASQNTGSLLTPAPEEEAAPGAGTFGDPGPQK
jgi:hypothetical protein